MCIPVKPVTISPFLSVATGFSSSFHDEKMGLLWVTIHLPNLQPSNGQAAESMTGKDGCCAEELSGDVCPIETVCAAKTPHTSKQRSARYQLLSWQYDTKF